MVLPVTPASDPSVLKVSVPLWRGKLVLAVPLVMSALFASTLNSQVLVLVRLK
jgi:hypothetical protein